MRLWYQCYEPKLAAQISPGQQAIFDTGHEVGRLATKLFPKGILIEEDHMHHREAKITTDVLLQNKMFPAIFEGAFTFDGIRIRVDVLERIDGRKWNLIEVKSSTSVKEVYKPDVAIQYHVLNGAGINVHRAGILHINNQYVFDGSQINLKGLFNFVDITDEILELQEDIVRQVNDLKKVLSQDSAPTVSPSRHCFSPYKCEFWDHCTKNMPKFWIINLSGISNGKFLQLPETINSNHSMMIVASELDDSSERIVQYLSDDYNVNINAIFFNFYKMGDEEILGRAWLMDPVEVQDRAVSKKQAPWSGYWFVNVGDGPARSWEDCRKYGFTGAGHGKWYSKALKRLNEGDSIFAYQKGTGYIGYGEVTGSVKMIKDFVVENEGKPLSDLVTAPKATENLNDPDLAEWAIPINWIKTYPLSDAKTFKGVFANQNIVCKLRHEETVSFLVREFGLENEV